MAMAAPGSGPEEGELEEGEIPDTPDVMSAAGLLQNLNLSADADQQPDLFRTWSLEDGEIGPPTKAPPNLEREPKLLPFALKPENPISVTQSGFADATGSKDGTAEPYVVRNTFIEFPATPKAETESATFFTWPSAGSNHVVTEDSGQTFSLSSESVALKGELMSIGSTLHAEGKCKPCAWIHKDADGCRNGAKCNYCHICPPGEIKKRKKEKYEKRSAQEHGLVPTSSAATVVPPAMPMPTAATAMSASPMEPCYIKVPILATHGPLLSLGSAAHAEGTCRPCAWFYKEGGSGCQNGYNCRYCHACPPGELKRRKKDKWELRKAIQP